jgi:hypothetical protein
MTAELHFLQVKPLGLFQQVLVQARALASSAFISPLEFMTVSLIMTSEKCFIYLSKSLKT